MQEKSYICSRNERNAIYSRRADDLLQYVFRLRQIGVTQAVMLNLALLIPATVLFSLAIFSLQRRLRRRDIYIGLFTWLLALGLMAYAAFSDGQPLLSGTHKMWTAVRTASVCFAISQFYFAFCHLVNLHAMLNALSNYYDSDMNSVLRWMRLSIFFLPLVGLFIPLIVFIQSIWLAYLSLLILGGVFFLVDGFCSYVVSTVPASIVEAEEEGYDEEKDVEAGLMADQYKTDDSENQAALSLDPENLQRVERAVQLWVSRGSYMKSGLKLPQVADEINVPRYLLTAWLRNQQLKYADQFDAELYRYSAWEDNLKKAFPKKFPTIEQLEKHIENLRSKLKEKDAQYKALAQKSRELSEAVREIENYLSQEQCREQQKKRRRNDLE